MELSDYQRAAVRTDQRPGTDLEAITIALLGLAGEAGSVATEYKKQRRDGAAYLASKIRMREELGDVLWYVADLCEKFGLDLDDVAVANLDKVKDRWRPSRHIEPFDQAFPEHEQLPRRARIEFQLRELDDGRTASAMVWNGAPLGDPLTDAARVADGYRFHDAFHLAYAAVLGWSPVMRALMRRKRKSDMATDEAEDGGRAVVVEEGISALVFAYASAHDYFDGIEHIDQPMLDTIRTLVGGLEVSVLRSADWERAILTGFEVWRTLNRTHGGTVELDADARTLRVV
ncbi:nucleoside triphosphate pyrophosphohydrolase family protein [Amycolatopsis mediterranei]|uniref:nucleoside triphosphate pyrophosphohydrolase family protein n=1 Tax=Amycolatopsis mediterranei TaxID=33910 RepID=UPI00341380B2